MKQFLTSLGATLALAVGAATARAQQANEYLVTSYQAGSRYETPPAGATTQSISGDDVSGTVALPFPFAFFGTTYNSATVCSNGWMCFVAGPSYEYVNSDFPLVGNAGQSMSGSICPYWDDLYCLGSSTIKTWTTGATGARRFVISWEGVSHYDSQGGPYFTFQVQLFEGSNSIVLSYPGTNWYSSSSYTVGVQAADGRYQHPSSWSSSFDSGRPANDWSFDYFTITLTGRVLYDRYVVDSSGIGNSSVLNVPLARTLVEAHGASGAVVGSATTDSQGYFGITARGVQPTEIGSLVVASQNDLFTVRSSAGGALHRATASAAVSFERDADLGTLVLSESNDPGGAARAPINIAAVLYATWQWASTLTADPIGALDVLYSTTSQASTSYTARAGNTPPSLRVSGRSANPDPWDDCVLRKTYARHVLAEISAVPTTTVNDGSFDAGSDAQNAFAEAFGYWLNAAKTQGAAFYDGTSSSAAVVLDLESPSALRSTKSPTVAAWVAEALYDLHDGSNESWDSFDGTSAPNRVAEIVDLHASPVTASSFYAAWLGRNYDGMSITANFIRHGLLADDSDEPNDDLTQPKVLPQFGVLLTGRILNRFNEDWYAFTLPDPTKGLNVTVAFDRAAHGSAVLALQLFNAAGSHLGTGSPVDASGPYRLATGALQAGQYRIRVALSEGGPIASYTLQAYAQLAFRSDSFPTWTIGRPYAVSLNVVGGIPPYGLTIPSPYAGPEGLVFDGEQALVSGVPSGPTNGLAQGASKQYVFLLSAIDSATPQNSVSQLVSFTLNDVVRPRFGEFTAFALGKPVDRPCPLVGGTPPYLASVSQGALPEGVVATEGELPRFQGTPTVPGGTNFRLALVDEAGYTATVIGRGVVCVPLGEAELAAGASACGWTFDALQGTGVSLSITTGKKKPVRAYRIVVLDKDGNTVMQTTTKAAKGKGSMSGFVAPSTGRFFCVVAAEDAGEATTLAAKPKFKAPKGAAGAGPSGFGDADEFNVSVPALAGAALSFTAKPDKSGLALRVVRLLDPAGQEVALSTKESKASKGGVAVKKTLPTSGMWTLVLGAAEGPSGTFNWSYKTAQPAKVVFALD